MQTIKITIPDDCEVQVVKKRKEKEPVIRTYQDLVDNNIKLTGYFIGLNGNIYTNSYHCRVTDKGEAASEKVAKSMLAMAMISQLMSYYGGMITDEEWSNPNMFKYVIKNEKGKIWTSYVYTIHHYLAFHTAEQRDEFIKYNEQLVKDYLMID